MKEKLTSLIDLQQIDSAIGRIFNRKKELPEELNRHEEAFLKIRTEFEQSRKKLDDLSVQHREKEDLLKKGQDLLKKTKGRQFEVKTNKEYEAILKEIETIEVKNGQAEDQIINLMDEMDRCRDAFKSQEKVFEGLRLKYETDRKKIEKEIATLDTESMQLQEKAQALRKKVSADLLKKYEAIKTINKGLAVVSAWKEICQGCHMNIPPQLYNELQKTANLISCPNCNRILYWDNKNAGEQ